MPAAATYCAITVAQAAPAMLQPAASTNSRSSPTFATAETARNTSGAVELPAARSRHEK